MTSMAEVDGERTAARFWVSNSAGLGRVRTDALLSILTACGCSTSVFSRLRHATGLSLYGRREVIAYLEEHLDELVAEMDAAALAASRRYGAWLRGRDDVDHAPAERPGLRRAWRRTYLAAWGNAYSRRLLAIQRDQDAPAGAAPSPAIGHYTAAQVAEHDVAQLDPTSLRAIAELVAAAKYPPIVAGEPDRPVPLDRPGDVVPGQRVRCLPGSLPARDGGQGGGVLVSVGAKTSVVAVYGDRERRIDNALLHPEPGLRIAAQRDAQGLPTLTNSHPRRWLPRWSWLGWTVADHLAYARGERDLPQSPPAPQRLVIVACGVRKVATWRATPAGMLYTGSYHAAARRAADAIADPGTRVMILSARYGLLDLDDRVDPYEQRLDEPGAITAEFLRAQADELGLLAAGEVTVLAGAAYADLVAEVWLHGRWPLCGTRGIGDQLARLAALAERRTTVDELLDATAASVARTEPADAERATDAPEAAPVVVPVEQDHDHDRDCGRPSRRHRHPGDRALRRPQRPGTRLVRGARGPHRTVAGRHRGAGASVPGRRRRLGLVGAGTDYGRGDVRAVSADGRGGRAPPGADAACVLAVAS